MPAVPPDDSMQIRDEDPTRAAEVAATEAALALVVDTAAREADSHGPDPDEAPVPPMPSKRRKPKKAPVARTPTEPAPSGDGAPTLDLTLPLAVVSQPVPDHPALDDPSLYFNRELSWLDFNWRVYYQALDPRTPLLERVNFVAITANNLDEFYRKRVGGLKRQLGAGVRALSPDGRTPREQLDLSSAAALEMQHRMDRLWNETLRPELAEAGLVVRTVDSLDGRRARARRHRLP